MIRAVALDLDDTLFLERDFVRSGFHAVDRFLRRRVDANRDWFAELWQGFQQGVRGHAFDRVLSAAGVEVSADLVAELVRCYREHEPDIRLCDDVLPALRELALPPDRLGVITDGPVVMQRNKFEALDLAGRIGRLICTDAWGQEFRKPHDRAFEEFEHRTGCCPAECAYVSDNPAKDFRAPHDRSWTTVRLRRPQGLHTAEASAPGEVDHEITDLQPLVRLLGDKEN